jgi:hypothetical protein
VSASTIIDENKSNAPSVPFPVSAVSATPNNLSSLISWESFSICTSATSRDFLKPSTNVKGLILGGGVVLEPTVGHFDFRSFGGIKNNAGGGITGDIDLTTLHHTANDAYTIILELSKSY